MVKVLFIYLVKVFYSNQKLHIEFSKELFKTLNSENGFFDKFFSFINELKKIKGITYLVKRIGSNMRNKKRICDIIKTINLKPEIIKNVLEDFKKWCKLKGFSLLYAEVLNFLKPKISDTEPKFKETTESKYQEEIKETTDSKYQEEFTEPTELKYQEEFKETTESKYQEELKETTEFKYQEEFKETAEPSIEQILVKSVENSVENINVIEENENATYLDLFYNNNQTIYHLEELQNKEISFKIIQNSEPYKIPINTLDSDNIHCNIDNIINSDIIHCNFDNIIDSDTTNLLSSTKLSDIEISEDSIKIKEYSIIRNKIIIPKKPTENVIISEIQDKNTIDTNALNRKSNKSVYKFLISFSLKSQEKLFLEEYFLNQNEIKNQKECVKYIQDIVRQNYKKINNVCQINFTSHGYNKDKSILRLYGKCLHIQCRKYMFKIFLREAIISVKVFATKNNIVHSSSNIKHQQIRAVRRKLAKEDLKHEFATTYRNKKLARMSKDLYNVGNSDNLLSNEVSRKIKSEVLQRFSRHKDHFIDLYLMKSEKKWNTFIQKVCSPQEVYLFSKDQIQISQAKNNFLIKLSRNSLFFDATGGIVQKFDNESKRVFLYTVLLHARNKSGKGISIPVAEALLSSHYENDIRRFIMELQIFCVVNNLNWPLCKRIVTDYSWIMIKACVKGFNKDTDSVIAYLNKCYLVLQEKKKLNFVIVQICCYHMIKIFSKKVSLYSSNEENLNIYKRYLIKAINISNINELFNWFENFTIILISPYKNSQYQNAVKKLSKLDDLESDENIFEDSSKDILDEKSPNYLKSPFYKKGLQIYLKLKNKINKEKDESADNNLKNEELLQYILKKYIPYVPLWTNVMGTLVDDTHTRISNSPVEGYFSLLKNILLNGKRNIRTTEYVRISKDYIQAKINELETKYQLPANSNEKRKAKLILPEEKWKRTPKKNKEKLNKTILHGEKLFRKKDIALPIYNSERFPRKIKDVKIIVGDYRPIFESLYGTLKPFQTTTVYLNEFESLNHRKNLFNNIVEIYMHILLYEFKVTKIEICTCEQGKAIFYTKSVKLQEIFNFKTASAIIIPILYREHFTLVYINTVENIINYIDPLGEKENTKQEIYSTILKSISEVEFNTEEWVMQQLEHPIQSDIFNCGVLCCQFLEAILTKRDLNDITNPNEYRNTMKEKLRAMSKDRTDECLHCEGVPNVSFARCIKCNNMVDEGCVQYYYKTSDLKNTTFKCFLCTYNT